MSCVNNASCGTVAYAVANDGAGVLSGYAWSENAGWVSMSCANTASCGTVSYGVSIDPISGDFSGRAWSENTGWITFASSGANPYKVTTGWNCSPAPSPPSNPPLLTLARIGTGTDTELSWTAVAGATGWAIVRGDLTDLLVSGGNFAVATLDCLDFNRTTATLEYGPNPAAGDVFWFLVRGVNCGGDGPYETGQPSQIGLRDAEIAASGNDCP